MKKLVYFAAVLLVGTLASCEKEEVGGTATESMAGQWVVQIDAVDEDGNPIANGEDYMGAGQTILMTYNTSANNANEMWIDDMGEWNLSEAYADYFNAYGPFPTYCIKAKVNVNQDALTFSSNEAENFGPGYEWWTTVPRVDSNGDPVLDEDGEQIIDDVLVHGEYAMPVTIDGKILKGAGRQNNGSPADSIVFFVTYKNDPWYPDDGYAKYKVSGIRYSGLVENER